MSLSEASFIVALVATGAVVAWIGDIVGYRLGKRRVSLFGIRPRTTAVIIGVCSGALISIVTITALSLTSRHVKTALFQMDEVQEKLSGLELRTLRQETQIKQQKQEIKQAEQRTEDARRQEALASRDVARLKSDIATRKRALAGLQADLEKVRRLQGQTEARNRELAQKARQLAGKIKASEAELAVVEAKLERQEGFLTYVSRGLVYAQMEDPIITAQEELARNVIDTGQPTPNVRAAIVELLQQAGAYAAERGARTGENERAVLYYAVALSGEPEAQIQELPEPQAIDEFVDFLVRQQHKSNAVRIIARFNAWRDQQVKVGLEPRANRLVFASGEVAGSMVVDGSLPDAELYQWISALLTLRVRSEAHGRRMLTVPNEVKYGSITYTEIFAAMEEIRRRKGPVQVDAVVAQDTWTVGPLELDLRLASVATDERIGRSPDASHRVGG